MQDLVERRARDDPNPRDRGSRDRVFVWKGFRRKYNDRVAANLLSNAKLAMCLERLSFHWILCASLRDGRVITCGHTTIPTIQLLPK